MGETDILGDAWDGPHAQHGNQTWRAGKYAIDEEVISLFRPPFLAIVDDQRVLHVISEVLLDSSGYAKLCDMGFARFVLSLLPSSRPFKISCDIRM